MRKRLLYSLGALAALAVVAAATLLLADRTAPAPDATPAASAAAARAALTVTVVQPLRADWPVRITASGSIAAWQEASIGTEANGLRLAEVKVNVGDVVRRGQVLAVFDPQTVRADLAQIRAGVAEAEATLAEAVVNAQRARELEPTGALSAQQINQYLTAERTAAARLEAQRALAQTQSLRLAQTQVLAPDNGVVSARSATVGAVLPAGQELFRLIRQGRLEWRAEVAAADLLRLKPGMPVTVTPAGGAPLKGTLRTVAPTVDPQTRNGTVFVDLPAPGAAKAGMFARGEFEVGQASGVTLPQTAVLLRDGFNYVLTVGPDSRVSQVKVSVGRRLGDRVEVTSPLDPAARVVNAGGGFLADGDTVRVVDAQDLPRAAAAAVPAAPAR